MIVSLLDIILDVLRAALKAGAADCFASLGLLPGGAPCRPPQEVHKQKNCMTVNFNSLKKASCCIEWPAKNLRFLLSTNSKEKKIKKNRQNT